MSNATQTPTADCRHCRKPIRQNSGGIWGARKRDDPHPWYCDGNPDDGKRHEPVGEYEVIWPDSDIYTNRYGKTRLSETEARATARAIGGTWHRVTGQES
jgi:hypothetical protein